MTWPFTLRIDKAGELAGRVSVTSATADGDKSNNTARLLVNPPAGTGDNETPGGTAGGEPGLPLTGAPTALLTGAAALLLAVGAATIVATRRRRSRFIA